MNDETKRLVKERRELIREYAGIKWSVSPSLEKFIITNIEWLEWKPEPADEPIIVEKPGA